MFQHTQGYKSNPTPTITIKEVMHVAPKYILGPSSSKSKGILGAEGADKKFSFSLC